MQLVVKRYLLDAAHIKANEGQAGAVTLIQRFGSTANLSISQTGLSDHRNPRGRLIIVLGSQRLTLQAGLIRLDS